MSDLCVEEEPFGDTETIEWIISSGKRPVTQEMIDLIVERVKTEQPLTLNSLTKEVLKQMIINNKTEYKSLKFATNCLKEQEETRRKRGPLIVELERILTGDPEAGKMEDLVVKGKDWIYHCVADLKAGVPENDGWRSARLKRLLDQKKIKPAKLNALAALLDL